MKSYLSWQLAGIGLVGLTYIGLVSCSRSLELSQEKSAVEAIAVAQRQPTETAISDYPPQAVAFEVCGELPDWQRATLEEQTAALQANPRYGETIATDPLKELFDKFWSQSIITFTTYGLSARTEPLYLSGVWTGIDAMADCHTGDRPNAINQGELAEMWLIGYEVTEIEWTGETYLVTVDATASGLQFVQFERADNQDSLPIVVVEPSGDEVSIASGDWSG